MVIPAQFLNQNFHEIFVYHFLKMEGKEYITDVERSFSDHIILFFLFLPIDIDEKDKKKKKVQ
ncbi:MAG: hypothetical protein CNLJKLNK_01134 [Holosporales bacterium]